MVWPFTPGEPIMKTVITARKPAPKARTLSLSEYEAGIAKGWTCIRAAKGYKAAKAAAKPSKGKPG